MSLVGWRVRSQVKPIQSPVSAKVYASACLLLFTVQCVWLAAFTVSLLRLFQTPTPPKKGAKSPSGSGTGDPESSFIPECGTGTSGCCRGAGDRQWVWCGVVYVNSFWWEIARAQSTGWAFVLAREPKWDEAECSESKVESARVCKEAAPAKRSSSCILNAAADHCLVVVEH